MALSKLSKAPSALRMMLSRDCASIAIGVESAQPPVGESRGDSRIEPARSRSSCFRGAVPEC
jgi:hypothetical protein